ncbi:hypothetical protein TeGR_g1987 [Tetraparma gracilis]|uniref:Uncharacterized protein n=1 Tax=Tetraparma gracilis TaxID=2962635 RepID=A0ABQ6MDV7_9STRA|nr:hypothetical protein TeGR_g1987 [Tetraparma gracilis]
MFASSLYLLLTSGTPFSFADTVSGFASTCLLLSSLYTLLLVAAAVACELREYGYLHANAFFLYTWAGKALLHFFFFVTAVLELPWASLLNLVAVVMCLYGRVVKNGDPNTLY